jgi:hypothetical protein
VLAIGVRTEWNVGVIYIYIKFLEKLVVGVPI